MGRKKHSTSQDSCEGGFGSLLAVDGLERLAQSTQLAKGHEADSDLLDPPAGGKGE